MTDANGNMVMPVAPYYGGNMSGRRGQYMGQQSGHYPPPWYPERGRW